MPLPPSSRKQAYDMPYQVFFFSGHSDLANTISDVEYSGVLYSYRVHGYDIIPILNLVQSNESQQRSSGKSENENDAINVH